MNETTGLNRQALTPNEIKYDESFLLPMEKRVYNEQYANMYILKIEELRQKAFNQGHKSWNDMIANGNRVQHSEKTLDVGKHRICWTVGTVYCDMDLKPSILEEVSKSHFGAPPIPPEKYTDKDYNDIYLEDESGRIRLVGSFLEKMSLVTGCVIAVLGSELSDGEFEVVDIRFPEFAPQKPIDLPDTSSKKYIAFISGLSMADNYQDDLNYQLLQDFLKGDVGDDSTQEFASNILHLVITGNSSVNTNDPETNNVMSPNYLKNSSNNTAAKSSLNSIQNLDQFISDLIGTIPVTIMPGKNDLTNITLPQQPIHKFLFRQSKESIPFNSLQTATNPQKISVNNIELLADSGQPLDDMFKYFKDTQLNRINLMSQCLRWQTLAPTAPDTLYAYPYMDQDPFLLKSTPHIYISGNQPYFDTRLLNGSDEDGKKINVRLATVPKFKETGELVLVDITDKTFPTFSIKFGL